MENNDFWDFANDTVQEDMTLKTVYKAPYGTIYYVPDITNDPTDVRSVDLLEGEYAILRNGSILENTVFSSTVPAGNSFDWSRTVGADQITVCSGWSGSARTNVIVGCDFPVNVSDTPLGFLAGCRFLRHVFLPDTVTKLSTGFLAKANYYQDLDHGIVGNGVTEIGNGFMYDGTNYTKSLKFPELRSIGNQFLETVGQSGAHGHSSFNQPLDFPELESIGSSFMATSNGGGNNYGQEFNSPMNFPKLKTIGDNFLQYSNSWSYWNDVAESKRKFNQEINFPEVISIGAGFLANYPHRQPQIGINRYMPDKTATYTDCVFNQKVILPKVVSVGAQFLEGNVNFNSELRMPLLETIGARFLGVCIHYNQAFDFSGITSIGDYFMWGATSFDQDVDLRGLISNSTPNYFLCGTYSWAQFSCVFGTNSTLYLPSGLTAFGDYFLAYNTAFNQAIDMTGISSIGNNFLYYATVFNQPIDVSGVYSIGNGFLTYAAAFNQAVDASSAVTIGNDFLRGIILYNQPVDVSGASSIGDYFLGMGNGTGASARNDVFNSTITMPSSDFTLGSRFLQGLTAFNQSIDISHATSIGIWAFNRCRAFNQPLTFHQNMTVFPESFMSGTTESLTSGGGFYSMAFAQEIDFSKFTSIPGSSLNGCYNYDFDVDLSNITGVIGDHFLSGIFPAGGTNNWRYVSMNFNSNFILPSNLTTLWRGAFGSYRVFNQPISLPNSLTLIQDGVLNYATSFNQPLQIPSGVTKIDHGFLQNAEAFNQPLTLPSSLTEIGVMFLGHGGSSNTNMSFNQPLTIPASVQQIGDSFLANTYNSAGTNKNKFNSALTFEQGSVITKIGTTFLAGTEFNQELVLPQTLTSIGISFLFDAINMVSPVDVGSLAETVAATGNNTFATPRSTAASYTQGIPIKGANRAAWIARFPDRTSNPYRKLLDYGS